MQDFFFSEVEKGSNILLTGPGGTGKSYMIKELKKFWEENFISSLRITSTTGVSAISLGAKTIHSWSGIRTAEGTCREVLKMVKKSEEAVENWKKVGCLVIDEISMLSAETFDKLDFVAQKIRGVREPFGGVQLIITGDPLQLPPVDGNWFFMANCYNLMNFFPIVLKTPYRYPSADWFNLLMRVRRGECTAEDVRFLRSKVVSSVPMGGLIKPTVLNSLRRNVDEMNNAELENISGRYTTYTAEDSIKHLKTPEKEEEVEKIDRNHYTKLLNGSIKQKLRLKLGAQIMLLINLSLEDGLCNGSRGVVKECHENALIIQWVNGTTTGLMKHCFEFRDEYRNVYYSRTQFPIDLAFSVSIHKSQGCTLDCVAVDIGPSVFDYGQAYTALSRVRDPDNLYLTDFDERVIKPDADALAFVDYTSKLFSRYMKKTPSRDTFTETP